MTKANKRKRRPNSRKRKRPQQVRVVYVSKTIDLIPKVKWS